MSAAVAVRTTGASGIGSPYVAALPIRPRTGLVRSFLSGTRRQAMRRWMRAGSVLVCLAAVGMPAGSGSATGSVRAPVARRTAGPTLGEQILVDVKPGAPRALATGSDGSLFVADVGTARVY